VGSGIGFVSVIQPKIRSAANGFAALRFGSKEPIWNLSRMSPESSLIYLFEKIEKFAYRDWWSRGGSNP